MIRQQYNRLMVNLEKIKTEIKSDVNYLEKEF